MNNTVENMKEDENLFLTEAEKQKLMDDNINFIFYIANPYKKGIIPEDEIESAAYFGFAKALNSYKKNNQNGFLAFAGTCIHNEIRTLMNKEKKVNTGVVSMSTPIASEDGDLELQDMIQNNVSKGLEVEGELLLQEDMDLILSMIDELDPREKFLIEHRYGLNGREELKQTEIAEILNRTQAGISKMEKQVLLKLKNMLSGKISLEDTSFYTGGKFQEVSLMTE